MQLVRADPGWFADPHRVGFLRYWDGRAWTQYVGASRPAFGPGGTRYYEPSRVPGAQASVGGYEPPVLAWSWSGHQLTRDQEVAAAELNRWYRLKTRCDSWTSLPVLWEIARCLAVILLLFRLLEYPDVATQGLVAGQFAHLEYLAVFGGFLVLGAFWARTEFRFARGKARAWALGLSWAFAPGPQCRWSWLQAVTAIPLAVAWGSLVVYAVLNGREAVAPAAVLAVSAIAIATCSVRIGLLRRHVVVDRQLS